MTEGKDRIDGATALLHKLRQQAEEVLRATPRAAPGPVADDAQQLVYELQVHQVELEMQNEELQQVQRELVVSRDRYSDLYEFAPVGLLTVDEQGTVLEANLTACKLFSVDRVSLLHKRLSHFLSLADSDLLHRHLRAVFTTDARHTCDLYLPQPDGRPRAVQLESIAVQKRSGATVQCRMALLDISARTQAETALQESEARYRSLFENALAGVFRSTPAGYLTAVNTALVRMLGYDCADDVLALKLPDDLYLDPTQREHLRAQYEISGVVEGVELYWKKKNGDPIVVSLYARTLHDSEGRVVGYEGMVLDMTARKREQEALTHLAAIVESSDDAIIGKTLDGIIVSWNAGAERIYGYAADEVVGRSISLLVPPGRANELPQILERIRRGEGVEHYETVRVRKDGRQIIVSLTISPITDDVGNLLGASAIAHDITAQQRAEIQLRNLIDTTQDAVISSDRQGCIDLFNPAAERIFGYTRTEVQGRKLQLLMPEPYASEHDDYIARYERTGERRAIGRIRTVAARRKNGEVFPIELSVVEFSGGSEVRYAAFIRDISEKVHLQERLLERERLAAMGTTVAKLVHEIGNPLNSMAVATQLLQRRLDRQREGLDEKILAAVQSLRGEIVRLSHLLQEFRSLSRQQQFAFQPTNLITVVQEIVAAELRPVHGAGCEC